jgi:hypothetical protein
VEGSRTVGGQRKAALHPARIRARFLALEDNTIFGYKCDNYYDKASERGFRFDDPEVGIAWPEVAGGYVRPPEKKGFIIVQIQKGDTLIKIANRYHTTVEQIMKDNPKIKDKSLIYAGDYLYIRKK